MSIPYRIPGGLLFAVLLYAAQTVRAEAPVSLLVRPKVGRVVRLKTVVKVSVPAGAVTITQVQKNTLKTIKPNGDWTEEIAYESSTVSDGKEESSEKEKDLPRFTVTHDRLGKIKEGRKAEASSFISPEVAKLIEMLNAFILSEKPVAPNDTWQTVLENPIITDKPVTIKDIFLGTEKIDGKDAWKIKQTAEVVVDLKGGLMNYEATEWIDPTSGDKLKVEADIKNVPTQAGAMSEQILATPVK